MKRLVVVEKDASCRRLGSRRWPGCELWTDITQVTAEGAYKQMPSLTGIIAGGGNPCQGLSKLSSGRKHLLHERSALFYTLVEIYKWLKELAAEFKVWIPEFAENVVSDEKDIQEMQESLGFGPILMCPNRDFKSEESQAFLVRYDLKRKRNQ